MVTKFPDAYKQHWASTGVIHKKKHSPLRPYFALTGVLQGVYFELGLVRYKAGHVHLLQSKD